MMLAAALFHPQWMGGAISHGQGILNQNSAAMETLLGIQLPLERVLLLIEDHGSDGVSLENRKALAMSAVDGLLNSEEEATRGDFTFWGASTLQEMMAPFAPFPNPILLNSMDGRGVLSTYWFFPPNPKGGWKTDKRDVYALAKVLISMGEDRDVANLLTRLSQKHPKDGPLAYLCAQGLSKAGLHKEAAALLGSVQVLKPALKVAMFRFRALEGACDDALFDPIVALGNAHLQDPQLQSDIAGVYRVCGKTEAYINSLERALRAKPGDEFLWEALREGYAAQPERRSSIKMGEGIERCLEEGDAKSCRDVLSKLQLDDGRIPKKWQ